MFIIKYKKIFISISIALVALSLVFLSTFGLKFGIDFKGGALMEVNYTTTRPAQADIETAIAPLNLGAVLIQPTGDTGYIIKTKDLSEQEHTALLSAISEGGKNAPEEKNFNSIGPSVGNELTRKAILAIILVSLAIICFIAFAFRKVSKPISSWRYGIIAIVTLLHDVMIPVGLFTIMSHYYGAEVDTLFVVAVLTVLGLSVSDTIVVFDRIRENLKNHSSANFHETVGHSIEQVYPRSINTSLTVILVLLCLFFFGPSATKYFALMMTAGMFFGTYSSIFLASPLLVWTEEFQNRKNRNKK
ncbi:MAG: protein translocase subunit SecF [Candidatus Nomurabacteria bacterium]|nr:protein translocase subunit SecF [Candidatus Nomurabacteria bacterium]